MKRIFAIAAVVAVAAGLLAAAAYAGVRDFHGPVDRGGTIDFDALFQHGKPKQAGHFEFHNIPVKCDQGNTRAAIGTGNIVDVSHRRFHYRFNFGDPTEKAVLHGKFNRKGNKATGDVDIEGLDLSKTHTNCSLPSPRDWTAHKQ
ncbi:MAG: hypothetical protein ACRDMH_10605 [Solirubrobacterales bacterium]